MPQEFEKEIHEETSLTLKEKVEEFLESISIKWQEFLDWSDEKGLPLRSVSNFFEEKGIPAAPAILVALLLITGGVYLAFLTATAPATKSFTITVRDTENQPVENAAVQLQFSTPEGLQTKTLTTDADGKAKFEKIPASQATVAVTASDYNSETRQATIPAEQDSKTLTVTLGRIDNPNVIMSVAVTGPAADVILLDSNGTQVDVQNATTLAQFEVLPNANYTVITRALGYREEFKVIAVSTANINIPVKLFREGEDRTAPVYARVYEEDGVTPVASAVVKILDKATQSVLTSSETGEDGASPAMEVAVGRNVSVTIIANGFLAWSLPSLTVNEPEATVVAKLIKRTEENSKNIVITVVDQDGNNMRQPTVALYCGDFVEEKTPENGVAGFDVAIGTTCLASVSKEGYVPAQVQLTSAVEQTIALQKATSANSGVIVVETLDKNGNTIAGVDVALFTNGAPLGSAMQSSIDGTAKFEFLPIGEITIIASTTGLEGIANVTVEPVEKTGIEGKRVAITMNPAKAKLVVDVLDHFQRGYVSNAVVEITHENGNVTTCTAINGTCIAFVETGKATALVSAPGFEKLSTKFDVQPGDNQQVFELISIEVADDTELVFVGMFNDNNQRVTVLNPATRYTAKYILKAPSIGFTSAKAFVQVGEQDVDIESGAAAIVSFSSTGKAIGGIDYSLADYFEEQSGSLSLVQEELRPVAPTEVLPTGDLSPLPSTSGTSASLASERFKWVEFTFDKFEGTKELNVVIQTAAVQEGNVELFHRTSYNVPSEGKTEVFRNPVDEDADVKKSSLFAALSEPVIIPIHFEGKCSEDTCLELWFEGSTGRKSGFEQFEAVVPEVFKLNYRVLNAFQTTGGFSTISLQTESEALEIQGTTSQQVKEGEDGFFALKAVKFTNDAQMLLTLAGQASFEEELHIGISNAGNELKVTTPLQINAFEENNVEIKVVDKFGAIVTSGRVVLEKGPTLANSVDATEEKPGVYTALVTPQMFGELSYLVQAAGFKNKKGKISVSAKNIVSIEPATGLTVSTDSFEPTEGSSFTVTNLIPNKEVKVSLSVIPSGQPKYSVASVSDPVFTLKGGESKSISLVANIRNEVIPFSSQPVTLKENYTGKINVNAKTGGFSQNTNLNFLASAIVQQQQLSQLIDYSSDSLDFAVDLPRKTKDYNTVKVTNNAGKPVLINQQSGLQGVFVTPVSAVIPPGGSTDFNVSGSPSPFNLAEQCVFEDLSEKGSIQFTASFQGITTVKNIDVDIQTTSHSRCIIPGALTVVLPMDVNFVFPPGTIAATTQAFDSSQAVRLPHGEMAVFHQGSQVTDQRAYLPASVGIELPSQYVSPAGLEQFEVRFPFHAIVAIPPQAQQSTLPDGSIKLSTLAAEIILPGGLQQGFQGGTTFSSKQDPYAGFRSLTDYQRFGSFFGTRSSYMLPAFTPLKIVSTRALTGEPFDITYNEEVYIDFSGDSQVRQTGSTVVADLPACANLNIYSKVENNKQIRDVLPSSRQVTIQGAVLSGRTAKISKGGKITLQTCLQVDEDAKMFQTRLRAPVTFVLPPGTPDPRPSMQVSFPNCAELVYKSDYSLGVALVKKVKFPQGSKVKEQLENDGAREIEVNAEETIAFSPCRSTTPSVSSFAGLGLEAKTSNNAPIVFTFTEADIGKTKEFQSICLVNHRSGVVSSNSDSFISSVSDIAVKEAKLELKSVKPHTVLELSPSRKGQCNNEFKLLATIPNSVHDGKCITRPIEIAANVIFTAVDSTGWTGTSSLPMKIIVKHGNQCPRDHELQAATTFSSFFVDYENSHANERTGKAFVFTFKGTGENHGRVLTILNNLDSPVSIETIGTSAISCAFPSSLPPAGAAAVKCTPQKPTSGVEVLKIKASYGSEYSEKTVNVQVFNGKKEVYQNSSWGELTPRSEVSKQSQAAASFISLASDESIGQTRKIQQQEMTGFLATCSTHYCTFEDGQHAFDDFLIELSKIAHEKLVDDKVQKAFCAPLANAGQYKKTTIIHLANTKQDFANYIRSPAVQSSVPYSVEDIPSVSGCGVYAITAKLDLCSGTALGATTVAERKSASTLQIIGAQKLAECPRNLANAPLFLAGKQEELTVFVGNDVGAGFQKPAFLKFGGIFSLGPYMQSESREDVKTVENLFATIYGEPIPKTTANKPTKYEHTLFCTKRALQQIPVILAGGAAIAGAGALTGLGAPFAARVMYGLGQAGVACGFSALASGVAVATPGGEESFTCPFLNGCIRSAIFGALSGGLASKAGAGGALQSASTGLKAALPSTGEGVTYALLVSSAAAGADIYNSYNGESPDIPPGLAGPTVYATSRSIASQITSTTPGFEDEFTTIRNSHSDLKKVFKDSENGRKLLKKLVKQNKDGLAAFKSSEVGQRVGSKAVSQEARLALQGELNRLSGNSHGLKANAIIRNLRSSGVASDDLLDGIYKKLLTTKGSDKQLVETAKGFFSKLGSTTPQPLSEVQKQFALFSQEAVDAANQKIVLEKSGASASINEIRQELYKQVEEASTNALKPGEVPKVSRFARIKNIGAKALPAVGHIATQFALDVDVRPSEFRLPYSAKNVLLVYHIEDPFTAPTLPTAHQLCIEDASRECKEKFYLANACNSDTDACILSYDLSGKGEDSYSLLVVFNNQRIEQRQLFDSIMFPEAAPVDLQGAFKFGSISQGDLTLLREKEADTGEEKALKAPEKPSSSQPSGTVQIGGSNG